MRRRVMSLPFGTLAIEAPRDTWLGETVIDTARYSRQFADDEFRIRLADPRAIDLGGDSYRSQMLRRGVYLGHHTGPAAYGYASRHEIGLFVPDGSTETYTALLWKYALKVALTVTALANGAIHLKATTVVSPERGVTLLVGRGGAGKTTMATALRDAGFVLAGNTHVQVQDTWAWPLNTHARVRCDAIERYAAPLPLTEFPVDGVIERIVIVEHNRHGAFDCRSVSPRTALSVVSQFCAAVGAYDLKEDVVDACRGADLLDRCGWFEAERQACERLLEAVPTFYLSADVTDSVSRQRALVWFTRP